MGTEPPRSTRPALTRVLQSQSGEMPVRAKGMPRRSLADSYHQLLRTTWPRLIGLLIAIFIVANLVFATLYTLDADGISTSQGPAVDSLYLKMFFFSVDTVATIGYGNMYPISGFANALVVVEVIFGILFTAFATGIAFARFSRPTARILFSKVAVVQAVTGDNGEAEAPLLMFRAANQRHNLIYEAEVRVSVLLDEVVLGTSYRRFKDLKLERASNPLFTLSWTVMHRIDDDSPLHGWLVNRCVPGEVDVVVVVSGVDAHSGQVIHGRWAYSAHDIRWGHRLVDIVERNAAGERTIDYGRFHDTEAIAVVGAVVGAAVVGAASA